ncbi:hypothetical protein [Actinocrispum wychmicini]|uniref:Uncharacterized protein n=1 Tax=Actinocrispum wychmicini TaxID=1213861 RepID=A0A4V2S6H4_9PSEU|nr:hypothetical protein [Actinocrispum wychmicini]TCO56060.1 hypothetical protein EV192_107485 [Actinocrispum wychmicini]
MIGLWPQGWAQWLTLIVSLAAGAALSSWGWRRVGRPVWPDTFALEYVVWERDRVAALAKGAATSAIGFLVTVVVALLKQEIKAAVPGVAVLGCLLGAVGLLIFAARMSVSVRVTDAAGRGVR